MLYLLATSIKKRKLGFFTAVSFFLLFVISFVCAKKQLNDTRNTTEAIIVASIANREIDPRCEGRKCDDVARRNES